MPDADCMMSTVEGIFHVANNSIEPLKDFAIVVLSPGRRDNRLMLALVDHTASNFAITRMAARSGIENHEASAFWTGHPDIVLRCHIVREIRSSLALFETEFCFLPWRAPFEIAIWSRLPWLDKWFHTKDTNSWGWILVVIRYKIDQSATSGKAGGLENWSGSKPLGPSGLSYDNCFLLHFLFHEH